MEMITLAEFLELKRFDKLKVHHRRTSSETLGSARKLAPESKGPSRIVYCLRGCQGRVQRKTLNSINLSDVTLLFFPFGI